MEREWTFAVVSECQRFVCSSADASLADVTRQSEALGRAMPTAPSVAAESFLRATLLNVAIRCGYQWHRQMRTRCVTVPCAPLTLANAAAFWPATGSPATLFTAHIRAIARELASSHPENLAHRAARLIAQSSDRRVRLSWIAREVGAHPATLRRAFQREFKMSAHNYLKQLRVDRAEAMLQSAAGSKIEGLAMQLGWSSKTSLYRAFRQVRGCTPQQGRHA